MSKKKAMKKKKASSSRKEEVDDLPAKRNLPEFENATEVIPQRILSLAYMHIWRNDLTSNGGC